MIVTDPEWSTMKYTAELRAWIARLMALVCYDEEYDKEEDKI